MQSALSVVGHQKRSLLSLSPRVEDASDIIRAEGYRPSIIRKKDSGDTPFLDQNGHTSPRG